MHPLAQPTFAWYYIFNMRRNISNFYSGLRPALFKLILMILFVPGLYAMAPSSFFEDLLSDRVKEKDVINFLKHTQTGISLDSPNFLLDTLCDEGKLCKVFVGDNERIGCFYFHPDNLHGARLIAYHPQFGTGFVLEKDLDDQEVRNLTEDVPLAVKNSYYLKEAIQKAFDSREATVMIKAYNEFLKHASPSVLEQAQDVMKKMMQEKAEFPFVLTSFLQYDLRSDRYSSILKADLWNMVNSIHEKITQLEDFEFDPETHRQERYSYQNYLHCLIQMSEWNGNSHPDVLLLTLLNIAEKSRRLPDNEESKKIRDRLSMVYSPFAERLGLTSVADSFRDASLSRKSRNALLEAIKEVYGRDYQELEAFLFEHMKPLIENALEGEVFSYKINARIKTLYSLKEKLESQLDKFVIRDYSEKQLKEAFVKVLGKMDSGTTDKGKSLAIYDLLGLQVVFDIHPLIRNQHVGIVQNNGEMGQSFIFEMQDKIKSLIRNRIGQEVASQKDEESGRPVIFLEKDKTLDKNGYIETKIMVSWKENDKMYRSEIQVMNNMDYAIQRHGSIAHWKYKIRDTGFSIDNDILNRLQFTLTSNYRDDFTLLAKELSKDVYLSVAQYGPGHSGDLHYLRLPGGSIAADALSARVLDYPSLCVEGIMRKGASQENLTLSSSLKPGDQLEVRTQNFNRALTESESGEITRIAKKTRTKLMALNPSPTEGEMAQIQKEFSKIIDSNAMLKGINLYDYMQQFLRLKNKDEIFLLAFAAERNTSFLIQYAEMYLKEDLGMSIHSLTESEMDSFFLTSSERESHRGKKNLLILSKILLAELKGKRTLEKVLGENFDLDMEMHGRLEYVVHKLGLNNAAELYPRLVFKLLSLEEILLLNNHAFSTHQLLIQRKGEFQDQLKDKVLKMIREFGYIFQYASRIQRTNEAIEINLLVPSLTMEGEDGRQAFTRERETVQSVYLQVVEKLNDLFGADEVDVSISETNSPSDAEFFLDYKQFKVQLKKEGLRSEAVYDMTFDDYERLLKMFFKRYNIPFVFRSTSNTGLSCKLIMKDNDNLGWLRKNLASFLAEEMFPSGFAGTSKRYARILSNCIYLSRNKYGREYLFDKAA